MTARRELIFARVDAVLSILPSIASYERQPSGYPDVMPALAAHDGGQRKIEGEVGSTRWALALIVEGFVEGAGGAATHTILNDLHADAVRAIMEDDQLAQLVEFIEPGDLRVDVAINSDARRIGFAQEFQIEFVTSRIDPALA